jgi:hypothetical protein
MKTTDLTVHHAGKLTYRFGLDGLFLGYLVSAEASFDLLLIREAWRAGVDFEDLADGFGQGAGTHGDWSAIRDSSREAKDRMLARALEQVRFGKQEDCQMRVALLEARRAIREVVDELPVHALGSRRRTHLEQVLRLADGALNPPPKAG